MRGGRGQGSISGFWFLKLMDGFPLAENETLEEECVQGQERVGEGCEKTKTMARF